VVEDLHWADSITLDYLAGLAAAVAECPALMVLTSRGEGDPLDTTWRARAGEAPIVTWDLSPLRKEEAIMLVSSFIDASDSLAVRCIERAAGNPLFLEQLLLSVEKGVSENVPDSIKSLVLSRMDQLSKEDKRALQAASVLGQRFDLDGLRYLMDQPAYQCGELVERHLVRPEGSFLLFAHALIQEGAYASLLKRQRTLLHLRAARWYSGRDSLLYAEHLDQAGDAGASKAYLDAATEQAKLYRPERALQLIRRGMEIAANDERFELRYLEGELLRTLGLTSESIEVYRQASELAGSEVEHCRALVGMAEGLVLIESLDELLNVLDDADKIASAHNLLRELAVINQLRGGVYFFRSMYEACLEASTASLKAARDADSPELEARALSGLGDAEYSRGRYISARGYFDQCIELARKHGYGRVLAANLTMRGYLFWHHNDLESAMADLHEAIELAVKTRHARAEMVVTAVYGGILLELGKLPESKQYVQRAMTISQQLGSKLFEGECYCRLSNIELGQGKHLEAYQKAQQAIDILHASESGMAFWGPCALADLAQATQDADERRAVLDEAEALLKNESVSHNHIIFYTSAMELCLRMAEWDEVERYARALQDYTAVEPLPRCDFYIARGTALAAFGRGNRDQGTMENIRCLHDEAKRIGLKAAIPAMEAALKSNCANTS
jgi:tetratricopeptide (TPR) repeat protein